ncbi:MAG TPA: trigger factor [Candidatus Dormibacteraeota bacterium]
MPISDLSVAVEELPGSQLSLSLEVPQAEVDRAFDRALQRFQSRAKIEGFRPGKAPREIVEARVGPAALREEAIEILVPEVVSQVLTDKGIEAIERPRVEIADFERGRDARFTAKVTVYPEVKLPDLDHLKVEKPQAEVTDQMVERRIEELRGQLAEITPVERPVREGDLVVADIDVTVDGNEIPSERRRAMEAEVAEGVLIPELRAAVVGKSAGEVAEAEIQLAEDHVDESLRSKPAQVRFTIQGVKEKKLPALDDEFAKQVSEGKQETVEALREAVREDLQEAGRRLSELAFEQAVVKAVVDASQVEVPTALVDHEVIHQVENLEQRLHRQGLRLDRYLAYLQKTPEEYVAEARPEAESRIRVDLVLEAAGKQLQIEPTEDEISEYMRQEVAKDPELKDRYLEIVANRTMREYFGHQLKRLKILEKLVEKAQGAK